MSESEDYLVPKLFFAENMNRFSMNANMKKIDANKYELYFTDFPLIISLPDNMQVCDHMDNKKPVGIIEFISESE